MMVIKYKKLYDPYSSVSILPTRFSTKQCYDFDLCPWKTIGFSLMLVIKYTKLCDLGANSLVSIMPTKFFYEVEVWLLTSNPEK
jgi:hypothetical protein